MRRIDQLDIHSFAARDLGQPLSEPEGIHIFLNFRQINECRRLVIHVILDRCLVSDLPASTPSGTFPTSIIFRLGSKFLDRMRVLRSREFGDIGRDRKMVDHVDMPLNTRQLVEQLTAGRTLEPRLVHCSKNH